MPLIAEFGSDRVEVRMYHTPNLTGLRKKYIPKRINEGWGLQHMKLYGVDDEIIMSGANLSSDYFTNRQDRYHLFHSKDLTDYFANIHNGVASLSFDIQPSDTPAGYFNMTSSFRRLLLSTHPTSGTVLTAHPHANGFFGSKGVSGMLPDAYTHLAKMFLRKVKYEGQAKTIKLREWKKGKVGEEGGWTYHAKGLWVTFPSTVEGMEEKDPSLTVIGSSNYTKRSYELDLEANVVIATSDPKLRQKLGEEVKWLGEFAKEVDEKEFEKAERKVGVSVKLSMWLVRVLGGAL
ncbi:hypothetical protein GQ44DRAFT_696954 [Phaeosphaeriaceae sp. PMI808]|nr:hypothetical protein GQ44DRAFT_696954 [Phaeosphaeriaceae sp. PMI808]